MAETRRPPGQMLRPSPGPDYPKIVQFDRFLGSYSFESGAFLYIVTGGDVPTEEALDMVEVLIRIKREELASRGQNPGDAEAQEG